MNICNLCDKNFAYPSLLKRHIDNKKKCNGKSGIIIKKYKCELCNSSFIRPSELDRHNISKKCKENYIKYNIHNGDNITYNINNIQNNIHLTLKTNGFSSTNIDILRPSQFESYMQDKYIKQSLILLKGDEEDYEGQQMMTTIFSTFIEIFRLLNFNLVHEQNHNCKVFLFSKSSYSNFVEYHLLEIGSGENQYKLKVVKYSTFIDEFIKLMERVDFKFQNDDFDSLLGFVRKNMKLLEKESVKKFIENSLISMYDIFNESKKNTDIENARLMNDVMEERLKMY